MPEELTLGQRKDCCLYRLVMMIDRYWMMICDIKASLSLWIKCLKKKIKKNPKLILDQALVVSK